MKTYAELNETEPFNWFEALNAKDIDWVELGNKASSWVTCACGNQCDIIPRKYNGQPADTILAALGGRDGFYGAVKNKNRIDALYYLEAIEQRSAFLINKINNDGK